MFNLEEFKAGRPAIAVNGTAVKFLSQHEEANGANIIGMTLDSRELYVFTSRGQMDFPSDDSNAWDLVDMYPEEFPAPPRGKQWDVQHDNGLKPWDVGILEGWRLLLAEEPAQEGDEYWASGIGPWRPWKDTSGPVVVGRAPIRTKRPLPQQPLTTSRPAAPKEGDTVWRDLLPGEHVHGGDQLSLPHLGESKRWRTLTSGCNPTQHPRSEYRTTRPVPFLDSESFLEDGDVVYWISPNRTAKFRHGVVKQYCKSSSMYAQVEDRTDGDSTLTALLKTLIYAVYDEDKDVDADKAPSSVLASSIVCGDVISHKDSEANPRNHLVLAATRGAVRTYYSPIERRDLVNYKVWRDGEWRQIVRYNEI